jgi:hypothetical protein
MVPTSSRELPEAFAHPGRSECERHNHCPAPKARSARYRHERSVCCGHRPSSLVTPSG